MNQFRLRREIKALVTTLIINESAVKLMGVSDIQLFEHVKKFCSDKCLEIVAKYYNEDVMHNLNRISGNVNDHQSILEILDMIVDRDDFHNEIVNSVKARR